MSDIIMPKMGDAMTEGKVVRWYKKPGDAVKRGEPVLEIETDKVNLDLEAEQDGTVANLAADEGQMVAVGAALATILAPGEKAVHVAATKRAAVAVPSDDKPRTTRVPPQEANVVAMSAGDRRRSSPLARRMAHELGVPLDSLQGSGPQGRIIAKDVQGFRATAPGVAPGATKVTARQLGTAVPTIEAKTVPLSAMRRTIAKRLSESTGPIPHFYLTADFDVTNLLGVREQVNAIEGIQTSINDYVIRAVALALRHHPNVNASWGEDAISQHGEVHIGVAVSTPEGLITPVVRNADTKSIREIGTAVRALAEKARNRKLLPSEYQGSTFTISNLGAWGIEEFTAIINPPNAAILAVGAAAARPVVVDRQIVVRDRMKVTLSCDHRLVDGTAGAEFLGTLRQFIEQPLRLIL